jgi:protein gp37
VSTRTAIAWTDHTFNPWWGCVKIDPGCAHCYAETFAVQRLGREIWGPNTERRTFGDKHWAEPLGWEKLARQSACLPRSLGAGTALGSLAHSGKRGPGYGHLVFCGSMCDWAEDHPAAEALRPRLWELIRATPHLTWQLLTKRADRIAKCLPADWRERTPSLGPFKVQSSKFKVQSINAGYPNVWLGVSVSEPKGLWRIEELSRLEAPVRFLSYEPALGDISNSLLVHDRLDWIIFGGESGPGHRAPEGWQDWARRVRDRCRLAGVPFFFKQSPAARTEKGTTLDGDRVREFPE